MVPEGKFEGLASEGPCDQLVAQADSEDRNIPGGHFQNRLRGLLHRRRVARTVGDEEPIGIKRQDLIGSGLRR